LPDVNFLSAKFKVK